MPSLLTTADLDRLIRLLADDGFACVGPTLRDGAIAYDAIGGVADLPAGWTDVQDAGRYRLERRADGALFGYNVGAHSWKKYLFPPTEQLWQVARVPGMLAPAGEAAPPVRRAFIGVRGCDLAAIGIQGRVFGHGSHADGRYAARRDATFVVAVNCTEAGGTCFCTSMGTGPAAGPGYDLALTELVEAHRHVFVVEAGSGPGAALLARLCCPAASDADVAHARARVDQAAGRMGRTLATDGLREVLLRQLDSPHWDEVGARCLACANCTLVCPTCFCSSVEDTTDLDGSHAVRQRHWDSCFNPGFSHLHGGEVRDSTGARYRQWLTHKLATWHDQFGTSGCVGCGRCVTWCPVGIDLTAEAARLRELADQP